MGDCGPPFHFEQIMGMSYFEPSMEMRLSTFLSALIIMLILDGPIVFAQKSPADSLTELLSKSKDDTSKVNILNQLFKEIGSSDPERTLLVATQARDLAMKLSFKSGTALALKNIGLYHFRRNQYQDADDSWQQALDVYTSLKDETGMSNILNNLGSSNFNRSNYPRALEYFLKGLDLAEKTGNKLRLVTTLNNVALCYMNKPATYEKAFEYFRRALKIAKEIDDKDNIGAAYVNMGEIYMNLHQDSTALVNFLNAKDAYDQESDALPYCLNSIGKIYQKRKDYVKALDYHQQSLAKATKHDDPLSISQALLEIAQVYRMTGKGKEALKFYQDAKSMAIKADAQLELKHSYEGLATTYGQLSDYRNAFDYQLRSTKLSDSLYKYSSDSIQRNYEVGLKKKEIDLLTKDKKLGEEELRRQKLMQRALMAGLSLIVLIVGLLYRDYRNKIKTNKILDNQKAEIESLLLNILPAEVADELQKTGSATPKYYESVTVLFTDFKGFTVIAEKLSPQEVVAELNNSFRKFDEIMDKYGMEKIKTIGDAYMCAGGIPVSFEGHSVKMIRAAMEMRDFMKNLNDEKREQGLIGWEMRIGIHVGPVVAGVVGKNKFAYDIWGGTVNIASRMESNGDPKEINISSATYELVKDYFDCTYRGKIYAKNVGEIDMYFVAGVKEGVVFED